MLNKLGQEKMEQGNWAEALKHFDDAELLLYHVHEHNPIFHPEVVQSRIEEIKGNRLRLKAMADTDSKRSKNDLLSKAKREKSQKDFRSLPSPPQKPEIDPSDIWYKAYNGCTNGRKVRV